MEAVKELIRLRERIQGQLRELQSEFETVNKAIQLLEREGKGASVIVNDRRFAKVGLSDGCRQIVANEWISPAEVRDALMRGGHPNNNKGKLLGSVFATMKRLEKMGEFEVRRIDEKLKYRKKQTSTAAAEAVA